MSIVPKAAPKEKVNIQGSAVYRYCESNNYTSSFGYEWNQYSRTYSDDTLGQDLSVKRLEQILGFPMEFLKGMNILELGCGAGRFTEQFVKYAKNVVAVDASEAIYVNSALGSKNALFLHADLNAVPELSQKIDLVFCRGVIQHTSDPQQSLVSLFNYVSTGGLVIFDVYKKGHSQWRSFKYFWRPILQKFVTIEKFDKFINKKGEWLYRKHHFVLKVLDKAPFVRRLFSMTPLYLSTNWEKQYPQLSAQQRLEIFKNELVDIFYAKYDMPMSTKEVIDHLARSIGQLPYSIDENRNQFRYKKNDNTKPLKALITKNGVIGV